MRKIYELGSINMDVSICAPTFPQKGETVNGNNLKVSLGGKGANQAIAITKAGYQVSFLAKVGNDGYGKKALETIKGFGLDTSDIQIDESHPTGVAVILLSQGDNRIIIEHGANYALEEKDVDEFLRQAKANDIFFTQYENRPDIVAYALKKAKSKGMFTVWNPSPIEDYSPDLLSCVDLLVVNENEAKAILSKEKATSLKELPVGDILLTLGEQGSKYYHKDEMIEIPAERVEAIDTTGAGDTFLGYFLAYYARENPLETCLRMATKASAIACTRRGASSSIPLDYEVKE